MSSMCETIGISYARHAETSEGDSGRRQRRDSVRGQRGQWKWAEGPERMSRQRTEGVGRWTAGEGRGDSGNGQRGQTERAEGTVREGTVKEGRGNRESGQGDSG